jgi:hypothetical protein
MQRLSESGSAAQHHNNLSRCTRRHGAYHCQLDVKKKWHDMSFSTQYPCPAVAEAEAMAGAALAQGRRLTGELAALRGDQTNDSTAAAAEASDLRQQLEQTRCGG